MADFKKYLPKLHVIEGRWTDDDAGQGPGNYGILLSTWNASAYVKKKYGRPFTVAQFKALPRPEADAFYKAVFWDWFNADSIRNQSIGELIVDWGINSGQATALQQVQALLKLPKTPVMESRTLRAINTVNAAGFFTELLHARQAFYEALIKRQPGKAKYRNGWMDRLENFTFEPTPGQVAAGGLLTVTALFFCLIGSSAAMPLLSPN